MIYFFACPVANAVKIGHTALRSYGTPDSNAYARMAAMQSSCPFELEMLATCDGDWSDEQELHRRFAHLRIRGEWFLFTEEIKAHIADLRKPIRHRRGQRYSNRAAA